MADEQCRYNNATKATWRGWAWNQVAARVPRGSTVMVLCGDTAADEEAARKRGLYCVGVDRNEDCVVNFRDNGGIAVKDCISNQLIHQRPDAVILDFLGGLTPVSVSIFSLATLTCKAVAANFLRGRDTLGKQLSDTYGGMKLHSYVKDRPTVVNCGRHRGKVMYCTFLHNLVDQAWARRKILSEVEEANFVKKFACKYRPCFYSYESKDSKGLHYDSIVITSGLVSDETVAGLEKASRMFTTKKGIESRRKAAACKAVLTMRKKKVIDKYKPFGMN